MNPKAIEIALSRIRVAERAIADLERCNEDECQDHWFVFITAFKSVYTALQEGAKGRPQSLQWMGGRNRERRADALLRYLYVARNDEEHGLTISASNTMASITVDLEEDGEIPSIRVYQHPETRLIVVERTDGGAMTVLHQQGPGPTLHPVRDRDGSVLMPPREHLGGPIECQPIQVAKAGAAYVKALVARAEKLPA